jgi:hypothetical protein
LITGVGIGDVLAVRGQGIAAGAIRLGAELIDESNIDAHIAVIHHVDANGTVWAIEGRPGGVGWRDAADYLNSPFTITNRRQRKTDERRQLVAVTMKSMLGTDYDDRAIFEDGLRDLHIPDPWAEKWQFESQGQLMLPGHVVCSSAAVVGYFRAGLQYPQNVDPAHVQPADWVDMFIADDYT